MKLAELIRRAELDAEVPAGADDREVLGLTIDSRAVEPGHLFVALRGANFDGHDYVASALEAGACAVVVEASSSPGPKVVVDDTRAVLPALSSAFYDYPSGAMRVCGVTGTNGKTTCSFIIESILARERAVGVLGTVNYRWPGVQIDAPNTTPESIVTQRLLARMRGDGVDTAIMEVSSHGLATHRVEGTHFDVVLFTNFSQDHLDFHDTMEDYFAAKARLFDEHVRASIAAGKAPSAVVNIDDPRGLEIARVAREAGAMVTTYGLSEGAQYRAEAVAGGLSGTSFVLVGGGRNWPLATGLIGRFNVWNSIGSLLAARQLGATDGAIEEGLADLDGVPGRLQRVGGRFFVDYAHTPDALETVLKTLRPCVPDGGRLVVLVGAGGDRDRGKRPLMGRAAADLADVVVVTNDNPRSEEPEAIATEIVAGIDLPELVGLQQGHGYTVILERRRAIERAVVETGPADVVLVAGKGHETYQEMKGVRHDFDDVAELLDAMRER